MLSGWRVNGGLISYNAKEKSNCVSITHHILIYLGLMMKVSQKTVGKGHVHLN